MRSHAAAFTLALQHHAMDRPVVGPGGLYRNRGLGWVTAVTAAGL